MNTVFDQPDDAATPLTLDERQGLLPNYVSNRGELNEVEQRNILKASTWAFARKRNILDVDAIRALHQRMFGEVWKWAGTFRKTERNIGIDPVHIWPDIRRMIDDTRFQVECESLPPDEIAVRFHHRLVLIHPFPNGNGRCSRLAADMLLHHTFGRQRFTWGAGELGTVGDARKRYITALRAADDHNIAPLLSFARS